MNAFADGEMIDWTEDWTTPAVSALAAMELCALDLSTFEDQKTEGWTRYNWDTGAAVTALKTHGGYSTGQSYRTASGELVEDRGPLRHRGADERGQLRSLNGRGVDVHKNLVSAALTCKKGDAYLWDTGGTIGPHGSRLAVALRETYIDTVKKFGAEGALSLVVEGGVYNFYLKDVKEDLTPLGDPTLSGEPRRAKPP
jgi:hypothetical protein